VPKRPTEELAQAPAVDFEGCYQQRAGGGSGGSSREADLLVMSVDGKGIVMRHEDLREETQRRAQRSAAQAAKPA
jgi:hypothetical protein